MKLKRPVLIQGGFEIPTAIVVECSDSGRSKILKGIEEVSFFVEKDCKHLYKSSKPILVEIQDADVEIYSSDSDHEPQILYNINAQKNGKILFYWFQQHLDWIQNLGLK